MNGITKTPTGQSLPSSRSIMGSDLLPPGLCRTWDGVIIVVNYLMIFDKLLMDINKYVQHLTNRCEPSD